MKTISILNDFSEFPGLRHCNISANSGEEFYHDVLNREFRNAYIENCKLTINLDNTSGYASSFLDEAFGNLVYDFSLDIVRNHIVIISDQEPHWKDMIENQTYIQWEDRRKNKQNPKVTKEHEEWFRMIDNKLECKIWEYPAV